MAGKKQKYIVPYESSEQIRLVEWMEYKGFKFTAIPNSTFTRSWKQKHHNTEMGLRPGLPDLLVIVKDKLVFIEMKRKKGGQLSDLQKQWIEELNKINNVVAIVCKGADEAQLAIDRLSNGE